MFDVLFSDEISIRAQARNGAAAVLYFEETGQPELAQQCYEAIPPEAAQWVDHVLDEVRLTPYLRKERISDPEQNTLITLADEAAVVEAAMAHVYMDLLEHKPDSMSYDQFWEFVTEEVSSLASLVEQSKFLNTAVDYLRIILRRKSGDEKDNQ